MIHTQKELVKRVLIDNGLSLTSMMAFERFNITRLAAVVCELRKDGYNIISIRKESRDSEGKLISWWTEYRAA